jgi:hypothetical protein
MRTVATLLGSLLVCLSVHSETLISGFSPNENPFIYAGFFGGSLVQNPDGTQTLRQELFVSFWAMGVTLPNIEIYQRMGQTTPFNSVGNENQIILNQERSGFALNLPMLPNWHWQTFHTTVWVSAI